MAATSPHQVSKLLLAWSEGEEGAREQLVPLVCEELHRLAKCYMKKELEMRYFGWLSEEEVDEVLKVSLRTVQQDWRLAQLWLYRELS